MSKCLAAVIFTGCVLVWAPPSIAREVVLRNSTPVARPQALVEVPLMDLGVAKGAVLTAHEGGTTIPLQLIDRDGDGVDDTALLLLDIAGRQTRRVAIDTARPGATTPSLVRTQAVIGLRVGATFNGKAWIGGRFQDFPSVDLPSSHRAGDRLTVFDGPGWESDRVGFRLYLDARNAIDVFGKKTPALVLHQIGRGSGDYHKPADWGMDILHVTDSLGAGGLGVIEDGRVRQVGPASAGIAARVAANGPLYAAIRVDTRDLIAAGRRYTLSARYGIAAGSRMTDVTASAATGTPIVAGIEKRANVIIKRSPPNAKGSWRYVATYGDQSFIDDGLGVALFYRAQDVVDTGDDGRTVYIRFKDPTRIRYAIAVAWAQEHGGIADEASFDRYLRNSVARLDAPIAVYARPSTAARKGQTKPNSNF